MSARIAYRNFLHGGVAVALVPDSEQTGFTRSAWLTGLISDVWRSKVGWIILAGVNDRIDFNRGGVKVATIAPGVYVTGAALCTAIDTAMTIADGATSWTITYSATTHKFTIAGSNSFVLLFGTGTNLARSVAHDLGFSEADTASATTITGARAVYQSRHWMNVDFGAIAGGGLEVVAGVNDSIDWDDTGGEITAIVAPGFYATPDGLCVAVVAALLASSGGGHGFSCTYDAGSDRFTIGGVFPPVYIDFLFGTGTNAATSIRGILGFTATDVGDEFNEATGAPAAGTPEAFTAAIIRGHSVSPTGTIRFDANAASMLAVGLEAAVSYTVLLQGSDDPRAAYFAEKEYRYVRFVFDDTANPIGYVEAAVAFVGPSLAVEGLQAAGFSKRNEQLSEISYSAAGTHQIIRRRRRRVYTSQWKLFSPEEEDAFDEIDEAMPAGSNFFITWDTDNMPDTVFGYLVQGLEIVRQIGELRYMTMVFAEALD